jgi:hypothetical protein
VERMLQDALDYAQGLIPGPDFDECQRPDRPGRWVIPCGRAETALWLERILRDGRVDIEAEPGRGAHLQEVAAAGTAAAHDGVGPASLPSRRGADTLRHRTGVHAAAVLALPARAGPDDPSSMGSGGVRGRCVRAGLT